MASPPRNDDVDESESSVRPESRENRGPESREAQDQNPPVQPNAAQMEIFQQMAAAILTQVIPNIPPPQIHIAPPVERRDERTPIERIRKFPIDEFKGDVGDPSKALDWLEYTKRCMDRLHFTDEERVDCIQGLLKEQAGLWWNGAT